MKTWIVKGKKVSVTHSCYIIFYNLIESPSLMSNIFKSCDIIFSVVNRRQRATMQRHMWIKLISMQLTALCRIDFWMGVAFCFLFLSLHADCLTQNNNNNCCDVLHHMWCSVGLSFRRNLISKLHKNTIILEIKKLDDLKINIWWELLQLASLTMSVCVKLLQGSQTSFLLFFQKKIACFHKQPWNSKVSCWQQFSFEWTIKTMANNLVSFSCLTHVKLLLWMRLTLFPGMESMFSLVCKIQMVWCSGELGFTLTTQWRLGLHSAVIKL